MAIFQVDALMRISNQSCLNTFYYDFDFDAYSELNAIRTEVLDAYQGGLLTVWPSTNLFLGVRVRNISTADFPSVVSLLTAPVGGTHGGQPLPPQCSAVASYRSITAKPNRARKYFGGLVEDVQTDGVWTTAGINAVSDTAVEMRLFSPGALGTFTLLTVRKSPTTGVVIASNEMTEVSVQIGVYNQRRRTRGYGQ